MSPFNVLEIGLCENVSHVAHAFAREELVTVRGNNAGALLPAMLQGIQPEVVDASRIRVFKNSEDAAFIMKFVVHGFF